MLKRRASRLARCCRRIPDQLPILASMGAALKHSPTDLMPKKIAPSYPSYNLGRWVMAGLVAVSHARDLFFYDAHELKSLNILWKIFYLFTGFGHQSVVVFFVLSGFFVGGKIIVNNKERNFDFITYFIDRFSRIYIVLVPALLLTLALDIYGSSISSIYLISGWSTSLSASPHDFLTAENFLASLLNITMYVGQPFGSDGALWSLAIEWLIYMIFPGIIRDIGALRGKRIDLTSALRIGLYGLLIIGSPDLGLWLAIWCAGAFARHLLARADGQYNASRGRYRVSVFAVLLAAAFMAGRLDIGPVWLNDLCIGFCAAGLFAQPRFARWRPASAFQEHMARFSFSLYITHSPIILFCLAVLQSQGYAAARFSPDAGAMSVYVAVVAIAYAAAWLFSRFTEARTDQFRRLLFAVFLPSRQLRRL